LIFFQAIAYRRATQAADQFLSVRVRVVRDHLGRDRPHDDLRRWLNAQIGACRYWLVGERSPPFQ
jgi:hypothetical protein